MYSVLLTLIDPRGVNFIGKLALTRTANPTRSTSFISVVFGIFSVIIKYHSNPQQKYNFSSHFIGSP